MPRGKTFLALQPDSFSETVMNCKDFNLVEATDFTKTTEQGIHGYLTMDPRTYNSPRQQYLLFDTPPLKVKNTQPLHDVYDESNNVKTGFAPYSRLKGGSIIYYKDLNNDLPYSKPVYDIQAYVQPSILKDPMGQMSTIYKRVPIPSEIEKSSDYSFDRDQMEFREDLISLQSQRINKNQYNAYHFYERA